MDLINWHVTIFFGALTAAILLAVCLLATSKMSTRSPSPLQNLMELSYSGLRDIFLGALGTGGEEHLPLVFTLFFYIFFCNMLELLPVYKAATADPSNTLAMGVIVFFYVQYQGIKAQGIIGYLKHFIGPMLLLSPLFILIEIIGELAKPFSLGMRLFGNIYGEDFMNDLATKAGAGMHIGSVPLYIPWQLPIYLLQIFTGAIQAFIFAILTCSYIAILTEKHEDHPHEDPKDEVIAHSLSGMGGSLQVRGI